MHFLPLPWQVDCILAAIQRRREDRYPRVVYIELDYIFNN